jgi:hypothetical protein
MVEADFDPGLPVDLEIRLAAVLGFDKVSDFISDSGFFSSSFADSGSSLTS